MGDVVYFKRFCEVSNGAENSYPMTPCGLTVWIPEARVNRLPARDVEMSVEFSGELEIFIFSTNVMLL